MSRASLRALAALAALAAIGVAAPGCGGGATQLNVFSTDWSDDRGASMDAVRRRLAGARPGPSTDVVVGVAGNADKIVGLPLGGGPKWTFAHPLDARPIVTGSVVIGTGGGELFALDAARGTRLWSRATGGLALHGAGDDGAAVSVITLSQAGGRGSVLLAVTHDGSVVRQVETDKALGVPAVLSRIAFVPWGNQYVSAIDLSDGGEVGRVVLREQVSRAWTDSGALYFGEVGIFRFDAQIREASRGGASHVALPLRELPGTPALMTSGNTRLPPVAGATDRIRLYAHPSDPTGPLKIEDDRFYATYFRIVMGFDAKHGGLTWVRVHPDDVLGGDVATGALVLCDEQGRVSVFGASGGGAMGQLDLGEPLKACAVQIDEWKPNGAPPRTEPLARQIAVSVKSHEPQLATGNRFLLHELATLDDESITTTLVELTADPRVAPVLATDARAALANRRSGARVMIDALARHYDFLKDELRPPPVGPIAEALAAMNEKGGAAALASHLLDPADSDDDVKRAAAALVTLGGAAEVPALKQFFAMYRATADNEDVGAAAASAGEALLKLDPKNGRALVDAALADPMTVPQVKEALGSVVQQLDAAAAAHAGPGAPGKK